MNRHETERVRLAVYNGFARTGRAPGVPELAALTGLAPDRVREELRALHESHDVVLNPQDHDEVVMAHPFESVPLGFSVMGARTLWWGGCAWDSFALPHLLRDEPDVLVATRCPACDTPHARVVGRDAPPPGDQVAHFLTPMHRAWDDVVHTCGNQRLFCSTDCVDTWLRRTGQERGYIMDLDTLWRFASARSGGVGSGNRSQPRGSWVDRCAAQGLYGRPRNLGGGATSHSGLLAEPGRVIMRFTYARVVPVTASLGAGLLLGLVGPVAGKWDNPACVAVGIVFSSGWPWACYAFLVGYFRRSKIESALLSPLGLAIGVVTYYLFKDINPTIPAGTEPTDSVPAGMEPGASSEGQIRVWGIAAFAFGAPVGLVGNLARTPGVGGLLFRLLVPLIAFFEATQRLSTEADSQGPVFAVTWNVIRVAACVVAVALMGHTVWSWRVRRGQADGRTGPYRVMPGHAASRQSRQRVSGVGAQESPGALGRENDALRPWPPGTE